MWIAPARSSVPDDKGEQPAEPEVAAAPEPRVSAIPLMRSGPARCAA